MNYSVETIIIFAVDFSDTRDCQNEVLKQEF